MLFLRFVDACFVEVVSLPERTAKSVDATVTGADWQSREICRAVNRSFSPCFEPR